MKCPPCTRFSSGCQPDTAPSPVSLRVTCVQNPVVEPRCSPLPELDSVRDLSGSTAPSESCWAAVHESRAFQPLLVLGSVCVCSCSAAPQCSAFTSSGSKVRRAGRDNRTSLYPIQCGGLGTAVLSSLKLSRRTSAASSSSARLPITEDCSETHAPI